MAAVYTFGVDWDDDGDVSGTGEDITARTLLSRTPLRTRAGRDQVRAYSPPAPGEATVEIDNQSRDYSPENTSSPLAGLLLPGRRLTAAATLTHTSDEFDRTVSSGWGTSTSGHAWTAAGGSASDYNVGSGVGTITLGSVNVSRRLSQTAVVADCRVQATISVDQVATGAPIRAALIPRATSIANDHQRGQINFDESGALSLSLVQRVGGSDDTLDAVDLDDTYSGGTQIELLVEARGDVLRAMAWPTAGTQPDDWQLTTTVDVITPSVAGIRTLAATGNTNSSPVVTVDDWSHTLHTGLHTGRTARYDVQPAIGHRSVTIGAVDALAGLRGQTVSTDLYTGIRTGDAIGVLLDAVDWPTDARDLDSGASLLPWWWLSATDAWTALTDLLHSEGPPAIVYVDPDGKIVFRDRHHRITRSASGTSQATFRPDGDEPVYSEVIYDHGWDTIANAITFQIPVRAPSATLTQVWQDTDQLAIADGQTIPVTATTTDPVTGATATYTALSGSVEASLSRTTGQTITIFVTAVGGPAVITGLALHAYPVQVASTVQVSAEDPVSVSRYGRRGRPDDHTPTWVSVHDAAAIAEILLGRYAERLPTMQITVRANGDTRLAHMLGRTLSDRVTAVDDELGMDREFWVEEIQHTVSEAGRWHSTTFGLEATPVEVGTPFQFDVSGQGFDDGAFQAPGAIVAGDMFRFDMAGQGFDDGRFAY